jgi:hypothetical protein
VLLVCGLLKDHHSSQEWRPAAAAVFVEARDLEQELCSDVQLHHMLWTCTHVLEQDALQQQQQQQEQQQDCTAGSSARYLQEDLTQGAINTASSSGKNRELLLLARSLLHHMQLESLTPAGLTAPHKRQRSADAQVLTLQEQQAILSGLLAEQKVLVGRMQALLLDPAASPVVELDAESKQVLLAPLQANSPPAATATAVAAAAAAAGDGTHAGTADEVTEVQLDLQLVRQLLRQHPDPAVRAEVYAAGLLQRLDGLLFLWGELAEIRRKIGRCAVGRDLC